MRFSEFFSTAIPTIKRLSNIGVASFGKGLTKKKEVRTPHFEINSSLEMYETNPLVSSGVNQLVEFIIPNKKIKISSKHVKTKKFLEKWHSQRKGIVGEFKNILTTNIICGNGGIEKAYISKSGKKVNNDYELDDEDRLLDNVFSQNNISRIYVNPDDLNGEKAFIFELDVGIKKFYYAGKLQIPDYYTVTYIQNYVYQFKKVYGIYLPAWKFTLYKSGWSRDELYGRSPLVASLDANNVFQEIISSWDTIARTRQLDTKLITIADSETGMSISDSAFKDLEKKLEQPIKSYTLFNVPLKFVEHDVKNSQSYDLMEGVFELVRRSIMMGLIPNHLTPFSDSATTMGSESALPSFRGRVKAKQNEFITFLNATIIDELRKDYPWLSEDASYEFDEPQILADSEYVRQVSDMISAELISPEEGRNYLLKLGIVTNDILVNKKPEDNDNNDNNDDNEEVEQGEFSESIVSKVLFPTFKTRLKKKYPEIRTNNWKELRSDNIGGKNIRLVKSDNLIFLYEGLQLKNKFDLNVMTILTIKQAYKDYKEKLKKKQHEFLNEETPEDKLEKELELNVKKVLQNELKNLFQTLNLFKTEKEGYKEAFLSPNSLFKLDGFFQGFNRKISKVVTNVFSKLNVIVTDDKDDGVQVTDNVKSLIKQKATLFRKSISSQIKKTQDTMLRDMKSDLSQRIAAGQDFDTIKSGIENKFNYEKGTDWKFNRIIRTDLRQSAGILKLRKFLATGFTTFAWQTRGDEIVREDHKKRNQRVYKIQDALEGKIIFPGGSLKKGELNVNCRCKILPYD